MDEIKEIEKSRQFDSNCHMKWDDLSPEEQGRIVDYLLSYIRELEGGINLAIPCLEDWVATTGFGAVNRRDRKALAVLKELINRKEIRQVGGVMRKHLCDEHRLRDKNRT